MLHDVCSRSRQWVGILEVLPLSVSLFGIGDSAVNISPFAHVSSANHINLHSSHLVCWLLPLLSVHAVVGLVWKLRSGSQAFIN